MVRPAVEQERIQMVSDIDLARLAETIGESRSTRGEGDQKRITAIHCDSLGLSLCVDADDRLNHVIFQGPRSTHLLKEGGVAVVWGKDRSVTFVHEPRELGSGMMVVDTLEIVYGERFLEATSPINRIKDPVRRALDFINSRAAQLSLQPQADYDGSC